MASKPFEDVPGTLRLPELEKEILQFWERERIFERVREDRRGRKIFRFVEGPPTANGMPHIGHALTRAMKDLFLRYMSLQGYRVSPWIGGWDCHGLPVEIEVEKALGLKTKKDIERFGVKKFNRMCRESVFRYKDEWIKMSTRIGFWLDYDNSYITMEDRYIESVWWALKRIYERGLLVKDYKVVPYCPRCGTPLSSHEVALGYREAEDPSIYVRFKIRDEDAHFLVWTTTPWTLPSNVLLAVGRDIDYVLAESGGERYYLAKARLSEALPGARVLREMKGEELIGKRYEQLIPFVEVPENALRVVHGDFVSTEEGTGIVHIAPAFGAEDHDLCRAEGVGVVKPVDEEGKFTETPWKGMFVKDADPHIIAWLRENGKLVRAGTVTHTYPFCWRCDTPLLYYALDTWFIKMTEVRDSLLKNNEGINWKPAHLKHGRFGNFLEDVKDWALSRNRYWGTPLPLWTCPKGHVYIPDGKDDLLRRAGFEGEPEDFELHRPWVDELSIPCPECGEPMKREPYLIDVWFDSGSAPFAQWHYPYENEEEFRKHFPVDFICEAIDQTRGWFYTLLAISTLLFDQPAYLNVLTLGLVLDEKGEKMSKSRGNVVDPMEIMESVGADALRVYFYSTPPWKDRRVSAHLVEDYARRTLGTLWNVYYFFVNNANLDGFNVEHLTTPKSVLDRWLISRLNSTIVEVRRGLDSFEPHLSMRAIEAFIEDLSNWYLRRSRRRFWREGMDEDKKSAYSALYTALSEMCKMLAPFAPFFAEKMYQNLVRRMGGRDSVHLDFYPEPDVEAIDRTLEERMNIAIRIAEAGRRARQEANVKLRQPLRKVTVVCSPAQRAAVEEFEEIIKDELNVKAIEFLDSAEEIMEVRVTPNFKSLGPRYRKEARAVAEAIARADPRRLAEELRERGVANVEGYEIREEDVSIVQVPPEHVTAAVIEDMGISVYLDTEITDDLRLEGLMRDVVRRIQTMRKEMDLKFDQPIEVGYEADGDLKRAIEEYRDYIAGEVQARSMAEGPVNGEEREWTVEGMRLRVWVRPL